MRVQRVLPLVLGILLATTPVFGASQPVAVSPGDPEKLVPIGDACPTFSWGETDRADAYELAVYRLVEQEDEPQPVLRERIVGSASSWTPSLERCLAPGDHYVWFVRAVRDGDAEEAGGWSEGRYFATPAGPTLEDVRRALAVLESWSQSAGGKPGALLAEVEEPAEPAPAPAPRVGVVGVRSVTTAPAALHAEQPDLTGETYGVVGVSSSTDGAGMAAANLEGGPDLVLDGSADGVAGTELSEWGINRPAATAETFYFRNTGGGSLRVEVVGDLDAAALSVDEVHVPYGQVINDLGDWLGTGNTIPCTGCVTSSDLAAGAVTASDLAAGAVDTVNLRDNAVTGPKIAPDAVTTTHIGDGALIYRDLADGAVRTAAILDGTIATADLADGAVTSAKIANGSVSMADLAAESVGSTQIESAGVQTDDIDFGAVGTGQLADGAVTSAKIADGSVSSLDMGAPAVYTVNLADWAVTTDKIDPGAVTGSKVADGAVGGTKIAGNAVTSAKIADGTITAADVDPTGGVYASKAGVYVTTESSLIAPFLCQIVTAECADANDLALQGYWKGPGSAGLRLTSSRVGSWDDNSSSAFFRIEVCSELASQATMEAEIVCVSVPGP